MSEPREHSGDIVDRAIRCQPAGCIAWALAVAAKIERVCRVAAFVQHLHDRALLAGYLQIEIWQRAPRATVNQKDAAARLAHDARPQRERLTFDRDGELLELGGVSRRE